MSTALRAEWLKVRFTRSLLALLAIGLVVTVAGAVVTISFFRPEEIPGRLSAFSPLRFGPTNVGLVLLLFAIRVFADETHHGTIAATYLATPDRQRVLRAKLVLAALGALAFCAVAFVLAVPASIIGAGLRDLPMVTDIATTSALMGRTVVAMTLLAVLGTAVAAAGRNRTVVLVGAIAWLALLENIAGALTRAPELLPGALVQGLVTDGAGPHQLGAAPAGVLLLGLTVLAAVLASWRVGADVE